MQIYFVELKKNGNDVNREKFAVNFENFKDLKDCQRTKLGILPFAEQVTQSRFVQLR